MAIKERTTIMIDRELLAEAQNTAARIGIPLKVAGSTSKFLRYLLQDFNAKNPKHPKKA
jgi:3-methyladenine DNA glycosylase Mpg